MYVLFDCNDPEKNYNNNMYECRGGSRISVKGFICIKVGVRFADFISFP